MHLSFKQILDNAELKKLQDDLGNKSVTYSSNLANKYGVDEIKNIPKEMTPHEARIYATKNTVKSLIERGVSEENALKLGLQEGENAFKFQTNYINNVNEDAKEKAKNRHTEVKETTKTINDEIKTLEPSYLCCQLLQLAYRSRSFPTLPICFSSPRYYG